MKLTLLLTLLPPITEAIKPNLIPLTITNILLPFCSLQWQVPLTVAVGNSSTVCLESLIWINNRTGEVAPETPADISGSLFLLMCKWSCSSELTGCFLGRICLRIKPAQELKLIICWALHMRAAFNGVLKLEFTGWLCCSVGGGNKHRYASLDLALAFYFKRKILMAFFSFHVLLKASYFCSFERIILSLLLTGHFWWKDLINDL